MKNKNDDIDENSDEDSDDENSDDENSDDENSDDENSNHNEPITTLEEVKQILQPIAEGWYNCLVTFLHYKQILDISHRSYHDSEIF